MLFKLQHRGQQGAKIYAADGEGIRKFGGSGMVSQMLESHTLPTLHGSWAIGQVRYATYGPSEEHNIQPLRSETTHGPLIYAHNGQFGSPEEITTQRSRLMAQGYAFHTTTDSELFSAQFALSRKPDLVSKLRTSYIGNIGSASIVGVVGTRGFAGRRVGNRPLFMGRLRDGGVVFTSEDYMLRELQIRDDAIGFSDVLPCEPGTLYICEGDAVNQYPLWNDGFESRFCLFELFYFSHPLTTFAGRYISEIRRGFGRALAETFPRNVEVVASVPDSGNSAAEGYGEAIGIPRTSAITRDHYINRTFIGGEQSERAEGASRKYNIDRSLVSGKDLVVIDDSLVRGTTLKRLVRGIRLAGARSIHIRIASPPIKYPSYDGTNIRSQEELLAANISTENIAAHLGADSLAYLSLENAYEVIEELTGISRSGGNFCDAIFTGQYWHGEAHPTLT
ncbi:MAG TPA: amidophosphoribosyltransferase [bacterium]|nr:amidophosphoribosyltransferase [bacterium]